MKYTCYNITINTSASKNIQLSRITAHFFNCFVTTALNSIDIRCLFEMCLSTWNSLNSILYKYDKYGKFDDKNLLFR